MVDSPCSFLEIRWRRRALLMLKVQHANSFRNVLAYQSHHHSTQNINLVAGFKRGIGIYEIQPKEESPVVKESSSMQLVPYCGGSRLLSAINSASKCIRPPLKKPDVLETRFKFKCISKPLIHTYQPQTLVDCFVINVRIRVVFLRFILSSSAPPHISPRLYDPP